jgi:hypothetical protein
MIIDGHAFVKPIGRAPMPPDRRRSFALCTVLFGHGDIDAGSLGE